MIHDSKNGKPRGYAFIEYENKNDMLGKYFITISEIIFDYYLQKKFKTLIAT